MRTLHENFLSYTFFLAPNSNFKFKYTAKKGKNSGYESGD
jgi:hypothetical protein